MRCSLELGWIPGGADDCPVSGRPFTCPLLAVVALCGCDTAYLRPAMANMEAGARFRDCAECPAMVVVPAASFVMGSPADEAGRQDHEGPLRTVKMPRPFAMGVFEVTFAEWDACVSDGGCCGHRPDDQGRGRGRWPVVDVNWEDAYSYVRWLAAKTGEHYRLPTEAEWEYVARAQATTPFHTGSTISSDQANYDGRRVYGSGQGGVYRGRSMRVGAFKPNGFGLHDMHGNVWEWVQDCYGSYAEAPTDGGALMDDFCDTRILRGGSWASGPAVLRAAERFAIEHGEGDVWVVVDRCVDVQHPTGIRVQDAGFRVVRELAR